MQNTIKKAVLVKEGGFIYLILVKGFVSQKIRTSDDATMCNKNKNYLQYQGNNRLLQRFVV
jgi:hypothetical protein